jgi:hypothetical protein
MRDEVDEKMDRKEFLKACTGGLCACATTCLPIAAEAAVAPKSDDWRLPFVKQRYAKLLNVLSQKMEGPALAGALQDVGAFCASQRDAVTLKFRGDLDGYCKYIKDVSNGSGSITRDDARKVYTLTYSRGADCFCPLNSVAEKTPGSVCECSIGAVRHMWSIVLDRDTKVEQKESVLRGGKVCRLEITPA